jgi:trehalose utilization protein
VGHKAHEEVEDAVVDRVQRAVLGGMGLVALHSAHFSKIFRRLMGTTCTLNWRVAGERERLWVVAPGHPVAEGLGPLIELEREEMYGEMFRSGYCFVRGRGRIFYFRPGHETFPTYHDPQVRRVIANAVRWAAPTGQGRAGENRRAESCW